MSKKIEVPAWANKYESHCTVATIYFDPIEMCLVGIIPWEGSHQVFTITSVDALEKTFEQTIMRLIERGFADQWFMDQLGNGRATLESTLESGEAKILIDRNDSDQKVGRAINRLLSMADGAGFLVQEKPK